MRASTRQSKWRRRRRPSACRPRTSAAPMKRLRRRASPISRGTEVAMDRFLHYGWPFFEPRHGTLAGEMEAFAKENLSHAHGSDADAICRRVVQDLGCAGFLHHCVTERPDVRSI